MLHPSSPRPSLSTLPQLDADEVRRALAVLVEPGQVVELRILSAKTKESPRYPYQASGYFHEMEAVLYALAELRSAKGVYLTLQPCNPLLLARAQNRLRSAEEMRHAPSTSDEHITRLRWLLVDLDPERPAGISSTEEEHQAALERAQRIKAALTALGWPAPVEADSGNGAHLLYALDLPVTEGAKDTGLLHRVLKGLAARFDAPEDEDTHRIKVDQSVYNPSRICKLYGTLVCKGDHTPERPHRLSRLLAVPAQIEPVAPEMLEAMAVPAPTFAQGETPRGHLAGSFDLARWIADHQLDVFEPTPWRGGQRWIFRVCPWNAEHTDRSAYLVQQANGAIAAGCQHASCREKGWKDLRALYETTYSERLARKETPLSVPAPAEMLTDLRTLPSVDLDFVLDCLRREEEGDARLYARLFRERCVYDHTENLWYEWQGHFWKRDECKHALLLVSGPLAAIYLETSALLSDQAAEEERRIGPNTEDQETQQARERYTRLKQTTAALIERARRLKMLRRAQSVLTYAQAHLPIRADAWDTNPWLLATPDGVIDLRMGTLRPGLPTDYVRTVVPTHWQGLEAPAPRFLQFLHEIFADREEAERAELVGFLQRVLGYGISGKVVEHLFLMLYGEEGRNGKDTLMSVLQFVLGAAVGPVSNDVILANSKLASPGSAKPHLCSLQGKRIAWASETDRGARFDVGQVKFLTGGGNIAARQLYGRDYTFEPSHLLVLLTNHKPHADSSDSAFWERLCPIIFNLRFVERPSQPNERKRDTSLVQTLQAEASGILAWLVRGCLDWQQQGLAIPASVRVARCAYREEEDTLGEFLQERCATEEEGKVAASELYLQYRIWTINNGLKSLSGRAFGMEMKKRVAWYRIKTGIYYEGLVLLPQESEENGESVVQDQPRARRSLDLAQQALLGQQRPSSGVGSVGFSPKLPYTNPSKMKVESFGNRPSLPTPDELTKEAIPPTEEPDEAAFSEDESSPDIPTPVIAYEEFDL